MLRWRGGERSNGWHLDSPPLPPLWGFFSRNQTAVFRNTEGDILPNVINFQVPRGGI